MTCMYKGCTNTATSTVPGYPDPLSLCFLHEREYADRYGHSDIRPILPARLDNADSVKVDSHFATMYPAKENMDV